MATACNKRSTRFHLAQCYDIEQNKTYYPLCHHEEKTQLFTAANLNKALWECKNKAA